LIGEVIASQGGAADRSGEPGVTAESLEAFFSQLEAVLAWRGKAAATAGEILPLGEATAAASGAFEAVQAKVDDYFTRCRLAAFDARASDGLNPAVTSTWRSASTNSAPATPRSPHCRSPRWQRASRCRSPTD
jgi:hypothetical protein